MQSGEILIKLAGKQWQIRNMAWSLPLRSMQEMIPTPSKLHAKLASDLGFGAD